jgi:hypothetical protein
MQITFERAKLEDALKLIDVQNLGFLEDYKKYGECPSFQEKEENMLDMIKNAIVYKIIVDEKIIGDIIVRNRGNGKYYLRLCCLCQSPLLRQYLFSTASVTGMNGSR